MKVAALLAVVAAFAALAFSLHGQLAHARGRGPLNDPIDFVAFRCASRVAASGADPYLAEPLRTCERAAYAESHLKLVHNLVVPAPLPPYALVAFEPLGSLPFRVGCAVWFAMLVVSFATTCAVVARLARLPVAAVVAALFFADLFASAVIGQIVPVVILAACVTAALLRAERPRLAALAALVAMVEPHLGAPLCCAVFLAAPGARATIARGACALAILSLAGGGLERDLEYLVRVLPAQGRAEGVAFMAQYSLSAVLVATGAPVALALGLGTLSYLAMAAVGIALGRAVARATGDPAFVVLVPFAAVLVGGPYVHIHQMAAALPLCLLLLARHDTRGVRAALVVAVVCLAIPWEALIEFGPVMAVVFPHPGSVRVDVRHVLDSLGDGSRLAEDSWAAWASAHAYDPRTPTEALLVKLPTWCGLALLMVASVVTARRNALPAFATDERAVASARATQHAPIA